MRSLLRLLATLLSGIMLSTCSSSQSDGGRGTLRGIVERVFHHGTQPTEGQPTQTVSAVPGINVIVYGLQTELVDSTTTDMAGHFEFLLPKGKYSVSVRPIEGEEIPTTTPPASIVEITSNSIAELKLQYDVYAP